MYTIGQFAKLSKTTVVALRFYDEVGILKPKYVEPKSGYRYYESEQLLDLQKILSLRQIGVSIENIQRICNGTDELKIIVQQKKELEQNRRMISSQLEKIKNIVNNKESNFEYHVVEKQLYGGLVYSNITTFQKDGHLERTEFVLGTEDEIFSHNPTMKRVSPDYCFLNYLDGIHKKEQVRFEYCQAVNKAGMEIKNIRFKEIPAVNAICCYHKGALEEVGSTCRFLDDWREKNGYEQIGALRMSFINGAWNREKKEDYLSEIQIPVRKRIKD